MNQQVIIAFEPNQALMGNMKTVFKRLIQHTHTHHTHIHTQLAAEKSPGSGPQNDVDILKEFCIIRLPGGRARLTVVHTPRC